MKYRLYIDESGNLDMQHTEKPEHRFFCLTGVMIQLNEVRKKLVPYLEKIKQQHFPYDPDSPPVLHRKELINKRYPFASLRDQEVERSFNAAILDLMEKINYTIVSVVIDKKEHRERYKTWQFHPYHYCLQILLERYVLFLESKNAMGDIMAESRGGREDIKLKESYSRLFKTGTDYISNKRFNAVLTSKELKVKPKTKNIAGLQLADLFAYPTKQDILFRNQLIPKPKGSFGNKITQIMEKSKYYRSSDGKIEGFGRKLLP